MLGLSIHGLIVLPLLYGKYYKENIIIPKYSFKYY